MTPEQMQNMKKVPQHYKGWLATAAMIAGAWHVTVYDMGCQKAWNIMPHSQLPTFLKDWESAVGRCILVDGEPHNRESEALLVQAGFSFYRADRTGEVKQASYTQRADGSAGARGWKKSPLTVQDVNMDPYGLWL